jgi:hypothetical protein
MCFDYPYPPFSFLRRSISPRFVICAPTSMPVNLQSLYRTCVISNSELLSRLQSSTPISNHPILRLHLLDPKTRLLHPISSLDLLFRDPPSSTVSNSEIFTTQSLTSIFQFFSKRQCSRSIEISGYDILCDTRRVRSPFLDSNCQPFPIRWLRSRRTQILPRPTIILRRPSNGLSAPSRNSIYTYNRRHRRHLAQTRTARHARAHACRGRGGRGTRGGARGGRDAVLFLSGEEPWRDDRV